MSAEPAARELTYPAVGGTRPADEAWAPPPGWRAYERTVPIGRGDRVWEAASAAVLRWEVKTRSGFAVHPAGVRVAEGADFHLVASVGPVRVREPVRVVAVVDREDRRGFAYGTLTGHPVSGEGAFVVHRTPAGEMLLALRSLTRPSRGLWRVVSPALLVAQRWYRRRYLVAL